MIRSSILLLLLLLPACTERPLPSSPQPYLFDISGPTFPYDPPIDLFPLTLATFNLAQLRSPTLLKQDLANLPPIEVFTFQEVAIPHFPSKKRPATPDKIPALIAAQLAPILPPGHWYGLFAPLNNTGQNSLEGQAILSRYPLQNPTLWDLDHKGPKNRAALVATITPPGLPNSTPILIINTDHEVGTTITADDRQRQLTSLLNHINTTNLPAILAGDFNTTGDFRNLWNDQQESATLTQTLAQHHFSPATPTLITFRTTQSRLDHIFTRNLTPASHGILPSQGSDHNPLWTTISLPPSTQKE